MMNSRSPKPLKPLRLATFQDMRAEWRNHVLALAPNGGQKRNLEMMLLRVDAGPLYTAIPKAKKAKHDEQPPLETTKAATASSISAPSMSSVKPTSQVTRFLKALKLKYIYQLTI